MLIVLEKISSIFFIIGIGFIARRLNLLSSDANKCLTDLLFAIVTPCMLFSTITSKDFTPDLFQVTIFTLAISAFLLIFWTIIIYFLATKVLKITPKEDIGVLMIIFSTLNTGFMGFPITLALFGDDIFYLMVIFNITLTVYVFSVAFYIINIGSDDMNKSGINIRSILASFKNTTSISAFISLIMLFTGLHFPGPIFECLETIGNAVVPVSMLMVGIQLSESNFMNVVRNKNLVLICIIKILLLPLTAFLLVNWLPIDTNIKVCIIFGSLFPSAVTVVPLATLKNRNSSLAAEGVTLTTLISLLAIPLGYLILSGYYGI